METALAIAPDTAETSALTRWDALAADIAIATEQAEGKAFDYRDKWDNKQARSWVAQLRKIKGKIERARKDAKAVHLDRGKAVDEAAKLLEASVQGLIEPHERELKVLEAEEQARIDGHKAVLELIAELAEGVTTSDEARHRLAELGRIDATKLEEFATVGASRQEQADEKLQALMDALLIQEAERAELERLRAEQAQRQEAERQEAIRQQAIADEREAAAAREAQASARRRTRSPGPCQCGRRPAGPANSRAPRCRRGTPSRGRAPGGSSTSSRGNSRCPSRSGGPHKTLRRSGTVNPSSAAGAHP
jgi:hypothetical protein